MIVAQPCNRRFPTQLRTTNSPEVANASLLAVLIRSLFFFFVALPAVAQVGISFNNTGLASLTYNGTNFLSYGDLRLDQVEFLNADGTITDGSTSSTVVVDATNGIQTRTYSWGTITESYAVNGNRLQLSVTVSNHSTLPIQGLLIEPFGVQFPSAIAEFINPGYPQMTNSLGQPAIAPLTFSSGAVALSNDDVAKPLVLGFPSVITTPNTTVPIALVTDRVSWYCGCYPTIVRPIAAGASDTFHFSLRFGPTGSTTTTLAPDLFQAFAAAFPSTMPAWPDHRAIGSIHLSTNTMGLSGWTTNPRGFLSDQSVDVTSAAGVAALQQRVLNSANDDIAILQNMNAQGMIAWDIEGEQFGPYNGDPTQLATLAPEIDPIADQYFRRFTDAGFRVGVTIRPQQLVIAPGLTSSQQNFVVDPTPILLAKAQYAHNRWGATLFYVDSNINSWTDPNPIDPAILKTLEAAMPDSLFFPEHSVAQYWAYSVPYFELLGGHTSTPATDRFTYPNAFSLIYTADGDIQGNFQALVTAVENGDILMYRSWYDDEPANSQIQSIYQAAGRNATSLTISINPSSAAVALGQPKQFTTTVVGTTNQQVSWSLVPAGVGAVSPAGVYTAPATMPSQQTVNIRAVSAADATKIASATISFLPSVSVVIAQQKTSLLAGQTQQFTAAVVGTSNQQVTWSLVSGPGSISTSGLYTAPASIATQQNVSVQATSAADSTRSATAALTVTPSNGVTVAPLATSLGAGQTQQFTATVTGLSSQQVTWSLLAGGAGTISASGLYTAPASITSLQTVTVQATSTADATKMATASVTLSPTVGISLNPLSASLKAGQTQQFTPTLTGTSNQQVTWSLLAGGVGTVSASGLYTAPSSITTQQTVTVQATSTADATKTASASVTLTPTVAISLNPAAVSLKAGQTQQFTPTVTGTSNQQVTWSLLAGGVGTVSASGLYTAPSSITTQQTVTVQAASTADATKTASASVTLTPTVAISLNPAAVSLKAGQTQQFTPTVTGTNNQQVTWSLLAGSAGTVSASGLYTAPSQIAAQGSVTVQATSAADTSKTANSTITLTPPPTPTCGAPSTNAFTGCYYNDVTFGTTGGLAFTRVDPQINFNWSGTSPGGNLGLYDYSVRWQGNFTFNAGPYTFTLSTDDGSRLYIDGNLVISDWSDHAASTMTQSYTMSAGTHLIQLDYYQNGGGASANLSWAQPASCGAVSNNAFTGCYFNDMTLGSTAGLAFTRVDPQINFNWNGNSPGGSLGTTNYSVKWQGNFAFNAGPYTFTLSTDDGSRLYVDGNLVINDWSDHAASTLTQSYTMSAGTHLIELDYYQNGGGASANLSWAQPASCGTPSTNAFTGCYFSGTNLGSSGGLAFSRVDPQINFNWNGNSPGGSLGTTNYSVKWQGNFTFNAAPYTFTLSTDDGSRLYVDGNLMIDDWSDHAAYTINQSYTMSAGTHLIELDYYQGGGGASANLSWASSSQPQVGITVTPATASLTTGQTQQFTASVTGTTNQQVTWSLLAGSLGSISSSGLYTAPASVANQQTVTVQATSAAASTQSATALITLTRPAVASSCGAPSTNAFTGCYFNDMTLGTSGGLAFSRVDNQIHFDWSGTSPGGNLGPYNYSVRWQGNFSFNAGPYIFTLATDDGSRLYVDGNLVIGDWSDHGASTINQSYTVSAGTHLIELDYYQSGGGASANLSWAEVPTCGGPSTNAFTGCYFNDTTLGTSGGIAFSRVDPQINFNWNSTSPGGNLGLYNYSVRWQGNFAFNAGPYTFTLATDDGSKLYVDGTLVIDNWSDHPAYTVTQGYTMSAGTHLIELDYYQAGGAASANLSWSPNP